MRLTRQRGNVARMLAVEQSHQRLFKQFKPYWQIAVELYDEQGTQRLVRSEIERLYGVAVSEKTAGLWINKGLAHRQLSISAASSDHVSDEAEAAMAA